MESTNQSRNETKTNKNCLDYVTFTPAEKDILFNGKVNADEIIKINQKQIEGIKLTPAEDRMFTAISEFFAYSTDNRTGWIYNEVFELPKTK